MVKDFIEEIERTLGVQIFVMAGFRREDGELVKSKLVII